MTAPGEHEARAMRLLRESKCSGETIVTVSEMARTLDEALARIAALEARMALR